MFSPAPMSLQPIVGTQKDTHVSHLFVVYALNFEATGERVPFAVLKERTERDDEEHERYEMICSMKSEGMTLKQIAEVLGYKSHSSISDIIKKFSA